MGSNQNNKKPIEVDFNNRLERVIKHLKHIDNNIERCKRDSAWWIWVDFDICPVCEDLKQDIKRAEDAIIARKIAGLKIDNARQYTEDYPGVKAVCDLVEFAREHIFVRGYPTELKELEINQVAPLDKTPRAEEVQPKTKHRPQKKIKRLDDFILADDKDRVKSALQKFLKNKRAKDCAIIVAVFMDKGYLQRPPFSVLKNEFNFDFSDEGFNKPMRLGPSTFYGKDFDTIKQALENQFPDL